MGLFDGNFSDPSSMYPLLGLIQGLGQAAQPSRLPVPFGSVLGQAAAGYGQGLGAQQDFQAHQQAFQKNQMGLDQAAAQQKLISDLFGGNSAPMSVPGFSSPQQFQAFAQAFPDEAAKRAFAPPERPISVAPGTHLYDPTSQQEVFSVPEKNNPNQAFNADGTPNKAYQDYEAAKLKAQRAPAWANVDIARQKQANLAKGLIEPETLTFMAQQILAGDKSPYANIGRGTQGGENIAALRGEVMRQATARGLKGADLAALNAEFAGLQSGERTLGTRTANVEMAAAETQQLAPLALAASANVDRTQYPTLNKIKLAVDQGTGDENVIRLNQSVNALVNTYSRAISPSGNPTIDDKNHAREILEAAYSKGQFAAAIDQMQKEISAARKSPGQVRGEFRGAISGSNPGLAAVPDAPGAQLPGQAAAPAKVYPPAPAAAIQALKMNRNKSAFDEIFGPGAADKALNGR